MSETYMQRHELEHHKTLHITAQAHQTNFLEIKLFLSIKLNFLEVCEMRKQIGEIFLKTDVVVTLYIFF